MLRKAFLVGSGWHRCTFHAPTQPKLCLAVGEDGERRNKQSRSEKKSRKAVQKLGMKPVPNVVRVQIKKSKNVRVSGRPG